MFPMVSAGKIMTGLDKKNSSFIYSDWLSRRKIAKAIR